MNEPLQLPVQSVAVQSAWCQQLGVPAADDATETCYRIMLRYIWYMHVSSMACKCTTGSLQLCILLAAVPEGMLVGLLQFLCQIYEMTRS